MHAADSVTLLLALLATACTRIDRVPAAAEPARWVAAEDISTIKDLTAVIALHGQPCGQVVQVKQQGKNGYLASCQDGNR
jgi:hypothetical protein